MHPQWRQDAQWAAISRATQLESAYRAELRRHRAEGRRRRIRVGVGLWLLRIGLRVAGPLTVEGLLGSN